MNFFGIITILRHVNVQRFAKNYNVTQKMIHLILQWLTYTICRSNVQNLFAYFYKLFQGIIYSLIIKLKKLQHYQPIIATL